MEDPRGRKGSGLSGGQWQRLAMARNFYRDASFMVMDEPTSAIDALAEHRIFTRLFADRSSTIIAISHRLATIEKADIVYMLEGGQIVEQGTHNELVALRGRYFRMFESQLSVPASPLTWQVRTGSLPSQAQAGPLAGAAPRPGNPAGVGPAEGV
jgi:ATP-binding cassette subfamily B protein/ATP-binding cassette subfamily C protein